MASCSTYKVERKKSKGENIQSGGILPSQSLLCVMEPSFSGKGWPPASLGTWGNGVPNPCFTFLMQFLFVRLLVYLLSCLISTKVFPVPKSFYCSTFSPPFHWQKVSELLWGSKLLAGAKSWQKTKTGHPESRDQTTLIQKNHSSSVSSL